MDTNISTKISSLPKATIEEAIEKEMILVAAEPNASNYQMSVKEIKEKIAKFIKELQEAVDALQPQGTENQVMLGNGIPTPAFDEEGDLNAPSSLFFKAVFGDAFDFVYGQFANKGCKLPWEEFMNLIIAEIINRGIIEPPLGWNYISTINLTIALPVNGTAQAIEADIVDENANYTVGEIVWNPDGTIANGTNEYEAMFSVIPKAGFFFIFPIPIKINNAPPTTFNAESDGSITLTKVFPRTMTALPASNLTITVPEFGANRPNTATQNDAGANNYSVVIEWTPAGATFPAGISTGTFTLTANAGYRWNSNVVSLNETNYNGNLSIDGMTLTFAYETADIQSNQGTFTDARDGKVYTWKRMPDGKKWMTINLDYAGNGGVYHGGGNNPPFANAGRLYSWAQALSAAPAGWRLPSDAEWAALAIAAGGTGTWGETGTAGTKLKANHTWQSNLPTTPTGTDNYGFAGLPAGYWWDNQYRNLYIEGVWWSSTEYSSTNAYSRSMLYNYENVPRNYNNKTHLFSIRCLQD